MQARSSYTLGVPDLPDAPVPPDYVLPDKVTLGEPGTIEFFSQRIDGRPYVNCMAYTACALIEFTGVNVPKDFGMRIREASGVPVEPGRGMSVAALKRGVSRTLPFVQYRSALRSDAALLGEAKSGQSLGLMIDFSKVPATSPLRLFVGKYQGGHAGWISKARQINGRWQVKWYDAFAGAGHTGRWLGWRHFRGVVYRYDGLVRVMYTVEGQGYMDFPITQKQFLEAEAAWQAQVDAIEQAHADELAKRDMAEDEAIAHLDEAKAALEEA